jgi:hypothetical protein
MGMLRDWQNLGHSQAWESDPSEPDCQLLPLSLEAPGINSRGKLIDIYSRGKLIDIQPNCRM